MAEIIEVPSGEIIEVRDEQLKGLKEQGIVTYVTSYNNSIVNGYVFYAPYRQDIYNYLDRTINFEEYLKRNK